MMNAATGIFLEARRKPRLPYDSEVEYVRLNGSTGNYSTGIFIDDNDYELRVDGRIASVTGAWSGFISAYRNETTEATRVLVYSTDLGYHFVEYRRQANMGYMVKSNWTLRRMHILSYGRYQVLDNGVTEYDNKSIGSPSSTVPGGLELKLSCGRGDFYIYGIQILHAGQSVMDLLPVRKGGVGYLYDKVNGTLIGSWGSVPFEIGPDAA